MTILTLPLVTKSLNKDVAYCDIKTKKMHRKSSTTKNLLFRSLTERAVKNKVLFEHTLADNWFGSKGNMAYIHQNL